MSQVGVVEESYDMSLYWTENLVLEEGVTLSQESVSIKLFQQLFICLHINDFHCIAVHFIIRCTISEASSPVIKTPSNSVAGPKHATLLFKTSPDTVPYTSSSI